MDAPSMGNRLLAEIVGTFGFFFIGFSGIAASVNLPGSIAPAGVAAGFGLGLGLHDRRLRADLRRPLQPGGHVRAGRCPQVSRRPR